ncbi:hypothetical protein VNI00_014348 [Paramarasmius palmivorus]|uniref:PLAC8-domain-containing protein n=1 Tax=Paramarasmius palmivorus TaxID=297713 RepID=A0AAW0BRW4_9AGAR
MEKQYGSQPVMMQPGYTPQMSVGGNRNAKNKPVGPDGKRDWSVGICGCGDEDGGCGTCFYAWCCPCIVHGQNKQRFAALQRGSPEPDPGCCSGDCWLHCCLTGFGWGWVLQMLNRSNVRERYGISGGCCGDCWTALCCTPCELAQERIELQLEEQSYGRLPQHA